MWWYDTSSYLQSQNVQLGHCCVKQCILNSQTKKLRDKENSLSCYKNDTDIVYVHQDGLFLGSYYSEFVLTECTISCFEFFEQKLKIDQNGHQA